MRVLGGVDMRVYVIWDHTSPAVRTLLEALPELCPTYAGQPIVWHIPSATVTGQRVARDPVARGLRESEHVIALLDRPSASVGWQVGLALGYQRSLQLAFLGAELPAWTQTGVLKGLFAHHLSDVAGVRQLLAPQSWELPPAAAAATGGRGHLILCPSGPIGSTLREVARQDPDAQTLPEDGWGLYELPALLAGCGRLIWVLASDVRDGADNAASGVVAGFAEASGLPVSVLRAEDLAPVVEVQPRELRFRGLAEFKQKLQQVVVGPSGARSGRASTVPAVAAAAAAEPGAELPAQPSTRSRSKAIALLGGLALVGVSAAVGFRLRGPATAAPAGPVSAPAAPAAVAVAPPAAAKVEPPAAAAAAHRSGSPSRGSPGRHHLGKSGPLAPRSLGEASQLLEDQLVQTATELDPSARQPAPSWPEPTPPAEPASEPLPEPTPRRPPSRPRADSAGGAALDDQGFAALLTRVRRLTASTARLGVLKDAISDGKSFSCRQIVQMMGVPISSEQKIQIAVTMYARVVDPDNTSELFAALYHESDRQQLRALLQRSP
jgi:hypothetical protein